MDLRVQYNIKKFKVHDFNEHVFTERHTVKHRIESALLPQNSLLQSDREVYDVKDTVQIAVFDPQEVDAAV